MLRYSIILTFLILTNFVNGQLNYNGITSRIQYNGVRQYIDLESSGTGEMTSSDYGYDSTKTLACDQKYFCEGAVENDDDVGTWRKTWTWKTVGTISYSIHENYENAFKINSSTGLIEINNATDIDITSKDTIINLVIKTIDSDVGYELDTAHIRIKNSDYVVYIDPDWSGAESGTKSEPYNSLLDVEWDTAYAYAIKRGTTLTGETFSLDSLIARDESPTIICAYGSGDFPKFDGNNTTTKGIYLGNQGTDEERLNGRVENFCIYNLEFTNYYNTVIETRYWTEKIGIYNCYFHNNDKESSQSQLALNVSNYIVYDEVMPFELINNIFDTVGYISSYEPSHVKITSGPAIIENNYFGWSDLMSLRTLQRNYGNNKSYVRYNYFDPEHKSSSESACNIQVRGKNIVFEENILIGANSGFYLSAHFSGYEYMPDSIEINNNDINGCYAEGIRTRPPNNTYSPSEGCVYENNLIRNCATGYRLRNDSNVIVRRNIFANNTNYGIYAENEAPKDVKIYYNAIYGSTNEINFTVGDDIYLYNNVIDGDITLSSTDDTVRNCYFSSLTGASGSDHNIDIDTITTENHFKDYSNHDYHLKSTAISAIDQGYDWGQTEDMYGNEKSGDEWDIGINEYQQSLWWLILLFPFLFLNYKKR